MAANKLIQQPDILNLDSLGAFMDAQNDPIPTASEEKEVTTAEETLLILRVRRLFRTKALRSHQ